MSFVSYNNPGFPWVLNSPGSPGFLFSVFPAWETMLGLPGVLEFLGKKVSWNSWVKIVLECPEISSIKSAVNWNPVQ